jgi:hypothetical protein
MMINLNVRRPEDRYYDLEEVCKTAIQVSENSQGMFSLPVMRREASLKSGERGGAPIQSADF